MPNPNTPDRRSAADPLPRTGSMTALQVPERVFDSHRFVKRLTAAGMEEGLAEVLAEEHMGPWIRNVATRADVANIREDLESTRVAFRKDLDNLRNDGDIKTDLALIQNILKDLRRDMPTKADVTNAIAAAERRLMIAMIGVAGVLFAALRLTQ